MVKKNINLGRWVLETHLEDFYPPGQAFCVSENWGRGLETACIYWLGTIDTDRSTPKDRTGFKHEKSDISSENCLGIAPGLKYFSKFICVRVPCYIFQNRGNLITSSLGKENPTNPVYICSHVSERFSLTAISYKWCNPLPGRVQEFREALYW